MLSPRPIVTPDQLAKSDWALSRLVNRVEQNSPLRFGAGFWIEVAQAIQQAADNIAPEDLAIELINRGVADFVNDPDANVAVLVDATGRRIHMPNGQPITINRLAERQIPFDYEACRIAMREFEGIESAMYFDKPGNITIGIGHKLDSAAMAVELNFVDKDGGAVNDQVKLVEYNKAVAAKSTKVMQIQKIFLNNEEINAVFERDINRSLIGARTILEFQNMGTFPSTAQLAILDLAYNLGVGGVTNFTRFRRAVKYRNWRVAMTESHRISTAQDPNRGIQESRNIAVANWLSEARELEPFFLNPDLPPINLNINAHLRP